MNDPTEAIRRQRLSEINQIKRNLKRVKECGFLRSRNQTAALLLSGLIVTSSPDHYKLTEEGETLLAEPEGNMKILTCQFVEASEVFKDCRQAWEVFAECDPDCTWGNNSRTMVTPDVIIKSLEEADVTVGSEAEEVKKVLKVLNALPSDLYIDLEN